MVRVTLEGLVKRFGRVVAVDRVSLEVRDGEFVVLLGPSGCGKTTTLRCIAGLETPDSGRILFNGEDVTHLPPRKRNVSMVFQNYAVWPHMTVYDNIAFPMRTRRMDEAEVRRRVKWAAELLKIDDLLDRYPHQLSGGQRQRVSVARAIVVEPNVLLMDEPLSNLDALLRSAMRSELKKLQQRLRVTTIYVTHDQVEAMVMADRIAVMNKGRLLQVGTPEEVYERPSNKFVAGFIGSPRINFFTAVVEGGRLVAPGFSIDLRGEGLPEGARVTVGVRPEDVRVTEGGRGVEAVVDFVERLGSETILHLRVGGVTIRAREPGRPGVGVGSRVRVVLDPSRLHLFNEDGERIAYRPASP